MVAVVGGVELGAVGEEGPAVVHGDGVAGLGLARAGFGGEVVCCYFCGGDGGEEKGEESDDGGGGGGEGEMHCQNLGFLVFVENFTGNDEELL